MYCKINNKNSALNYFNLYYNYLKFTQWDALYYWIIRNPVNTRMLNNIKRNYNSTIKNNNSFKIIANQIWKKC